MKIENLAQANELAQRLKDIDSYLHTVVTERQRLLDNKAKETMMKISVRNAYLELEDMQLAHEILAILISKYSTEKETILSKIETL